MPKVVVQKWEESERGWGVRPDGYSIHVDEAAREAYVKGYWASMPDRAPDEYSRPHGTPYEAEVEDAAYTSLRSHWPGERYYSRDYPGDGGKDGWKNAK